jgi:hypothetical protein
VAEEPVVKEEPVKFLAKANCKQCRGRGFVTRTWPIGGKKQMTKRKTLCRCVTEIKTPEPDECVVPKVAKNLDALGDIHMKPLKQYASAAQPLN